MFEQVVESLRCHLAYDRPDELRTLWADEHTILWPPLITAFARGDISDLPAREATDQATKIRVREDFVVLIVRDRFIYFSFDPEDETQEAFCRHAALAVAECIEEDLKVLLGELEKYGRDRRLEDLNQRVTLELDKFRRLQISGHVSNTGRQPCSVPNAAVLFLKTGGAPRAAMTSSGRPAAAATYDSDLRIDLIMVDASGEAYDFGAPIQVPAGGLVPFIAASARALPDHSFGSDLEAKLRGGGLRAEIGYVASRPGTATLDTLHSEEFDFIESSARIVIEAKRPHGCDGSGSGCSRSGARRRGDGSSAEIGGGRLRAALRRSSRAPSGHRHDVGRLGPGEPARRADPVSAADLHLVETLRLHSQPSGLPHPSRLPSRAPRHHADVRARFLRITALRRDRRPTPALVSSHADTDVPAHLRGVSRWRR